MNQRAIESLKLARVYLEDYNDMVKPEDRMKIIFIHNEEKELQEYALKTQGYKVKPGEDHP